MTIWDYAKYISVGLVMIAIIGVAIKLQKKKKEPFDKRELVIYLLIGVVSVTVSYFFFTRVIAGGWISSSSMEPTLMVGDYAISNGLAYLNHEPQRGDIITFRHAGVADGETLIKRIVGVPGDSLMFINGYVYINGEPIYEAYLSEDTETNSFKDFEDIPEGCYFVMGDNRENSEDSRFWEDPYVKKSEIRGRLLAVIPLARESHLFRDSASSEEI